MNTILNLFYVILDNIEYYGFLVLIFLAAVMAVFAIYYLFGRQNALSRRLGRLLPDKQKKAAANSALIEEQDQRLVTRITKPLHDIVIPKEGSTKKRVRLKLIRAGFRSEKAFRNFLTAKFFFAILFPLTLAVTQALRRFTPDMLLLCFVLAAFGYFLPNIYIWLVTKGRQEGMEKALPDALDLMVVCVESGLGLDMTFKRVGDEIRVINKDLSDEYRLTNLEIRAGRPRDESFKDMGTRTGVSEVHNLMTILCQTSRFGTSVAQALRVHADAMRIKRRQNAEEKAAKSTVKLIFPLVLFIFPAIFVVLVGPAAIQIVKVLFPVLGGAGG